MLLLGVLHVMLVLTLDSNVNTRRGAVQGAKNLLSIIDAQWQLLSSTKASRHFEARLSTEIGRVLIADVEYVVGDGAKFWFESLPQREHNRARREGRITYNPERVCVTGLRDLDGHQVQVVIGPNEGCAAFGLRLISRKLLDKAHFSVSGGASAPRDAPSPLS